MDALTPIPGGCWGWTGLIGRPTAEFSPATRLADTLTMATQFSKCLVPLCLHWLEGFHSAQVVNSFRHGFIALPVLRVRGKSIWASAFETGRFAHAAFRPRDLLILSLDRHISHKSDQRWRHSSKGCVQKNHATAKQKPEAASAALIKTRQKQQLCGQDTTAANKTDSGRRMLTTDDDGKTHQEWRAMCRRSKGRFWMRTPNVAIGASDCDCAASIRPSHCAARRSSPYVLTRPRGDARCVVDGMDAMVVPTGDGAKNSGVHTRSPLAALHGHWIAACLLCVL
ncbi:hypothetical protein IWX90DRAFT_134732 [Phyllosticta citrichinensis]|uniref:Uncharacterized protein n=1 Tax=Phyllosticta citrichinensis TaxID=1130410 RepID=A0ABR1XET4_9PEZI